MRNSILVLGAGHIGSAIAKMLSASGGQPVTLADFNFDALKRAADSQYINAHMAGNTINMDVVSFDDAEKMKALIQSNDLIINAAPHVFNRTLARMAIDANKVYFDMTEDMADTTAALNYIIEKSDFSGVYYPQCGLAPGYVSIAAAHMAKKFTVAKYVHMRVGALPETPTNSLGYALTWSIDGLVNEYVQPGFAIKHSREYITTPLEELEEVYIQGRKFEAFNTSGGVGTFGTSFPILETLDYKTVRFPGHCDRMKFLLNDLNMHPEDVKVALARAIPKTTEDMVVIKIVVGGIRDGRHAVETVEHVITPRSPNAITRGGPYTAIQLTTAQALCAVVRMHLGGKVPDTNIVRQEDLDLQNFLDTEFGVLYDSKLNCRYSY